jgi:ferrochelatase
MTSLAKFRAGTDAVLLVAHGSVEELDELPAFLTRIRRGHAPTPGLLAEVRRRYEAIGGRSPLNAINRQLAVLLEQRLGVPVRVANRLSSPLPDDVLVPLAEAGVRRVFVVPLAQYSASIYADAVRASVRSLGLSIDVVAASNWGTLPALLDLFAKASVRTAHASSLDAGPRGLLMTAHSLPRAVVDAGDPYEREVRESAAGIASRVAELATGCFAEHGVAFQSQGMSDGGRPMAWLGPDLQEAFRGMASRGVASVVVVPIGFLADHVEILYDIDIEAVGWARELGLSLTRIPSLNVGDDFVDVLEGIARSLLPVGDGS